MSITATTLNGAVAAGDTVVNLTSASGVSAPVTTTGAGYTWLLVEQELMFVVAISGTFATVRRGVSGTQQLAHATAAPVYIGGASDFPNFTPAQNVTFAKDPVRYKGTSPSVAMAAALTCPGPFFHTTGTTQATTLNFPSSDFVEGEVTIVFDGSGSGITWTTGGTGVAGVSAAFNVAGTATTAGSSVTFRYEPTTAKWIPSRLA